MSLQFISRSIFGLALIIVFVSCARFPTPPELSELSLTGPRNKAEIWAKYGVKIAQFNKDSTPQNLNHACHAWGQLKANDFPLYELIQVELLYCQSREFADGVMSPEATQYYNKKLQELIKNSPEWLHYHLFQRFNRHPFNDILTQMKITLKGTPFIETREEKVLELIGTIDLYEKFLSYNENPDRLESLETLATSLHKKLIKVAPRFETEITSKNIYDIARDFERARDFNRARELYQTIIEDSSFDFKDRLRAHQRVAESYRLQREMGRFTEKTQKISHFVTKSYMANPTDDKIRTEWFNRNEAALRAIWTRNETELAISQTNQFLGQNRSLLSDDQRAKLKWLMALMHKELGATEKSLELLTSAISFQIEDQSLLSDIYWSYFWEHYTNQESHEVTLNFIQNILPSIKEELSSYALSRFYFWSSQIYRNLGHQDYYEHSLNMARQTSPLNYYGVLASKLLRKPLPSLTQELKLKKRDPALEWLFFFGLKEVAKEYLSTVDLNPKDRLVYHYRSEDFQQAIRLFYRVIDTNDTRQRDRYLKALYPTPWKKEVNAASETFGVSRALILSIIRQESAFNHQARSWADAFGAMQLIPERATTLSQKYRIPYSDYTDLYELNTNIMMGAALLKELQDQFESIFVFYVPAYNAGERPVRHWIDTRFKGDKLEFIENIPYRETRGYIQHILRNYLIYSQFTDEVEKTSNLDFLDSY